MDKKILIGGGVAVAVVGYIFIRKRNAAAAVENAKADEQQTTPYMGDTSFLSGGIAPTSNGLTSGDLAGGAASGTPETTGSPTGLLSAILEAAKGGGSNPGNSGDNGVGGGFSMNELMYEMAGMQAITDRQHIYADQQVNQSAILASILGKNTGAQIINSATGTEIKVTPPVVKDSAYDTIVKDQFKTLVGRDPTEGGLAFWKDAIINKGASISSLTNMLKNSDEYKKLQTPAPPAAKPPTTTPAK